MKNDETIDFMLLILDIKIIIKIIIIKIREFVLVSFCKFDTNWVSWEEENSI